MSSILETAPALWDPTTGRIYTFMVPAPTLQDAKRLAADFLLLDHAV